MPRSTRSLGHGRLATLAALALLTAAALCAPASVAAVDSASLSAAETKMVDLLNADRTAVGLVPVRVDSRLMAIARARSNDMVARNYFDHTQPDGRNVFNILTAQGIAWYTAGEIIAYNGYALDVTADGANYQWMHSAGHKAIIVSTSMNYVGVGLAVDDTTGKKVWTAVYIKGPDRTGAKADVAAPTVTGGTSFLTRRIVVSWSGADVPLQVLTSGFHSFQVQRRTDAGAWTTIWVSPTVRSMSLNLPTGHTYEFRIAARDNAGNWGAWVTARTRLARPMGSVTIRR
jgi:uncharacterized protein YkwD